MRSFKWANLASHNAVVSVVIVGIGNNKLKKQKYLFYEDKNDLIKECQNINPYLISAPNIIGEPLSKPCSEINEMSFGNMPNEGGFLLLSFDESIEAIKKFNVDKKFIRTFIGSQEFIRLNREGVFG